MQLTEIQYLSSFTLNASIFYEVCGEDDTRPQTDSMRKLRFFWVGVDCACFVPL